VTRGTFKAGDKVEIIRNGRTIGTNTIKNLSLERSSRDDKITFLKEASRGEIVSMDFTEPLREGGRLGDIIHKVADL
jgi:hypothetical protein